jgi:anti-anti-sigma factor
MISSAGHLPPLLARPDEATVVLPVPSDTLIGAPDGEDQRRVTRVELPPGSLLCLYTDGLVERRDLLIDDGIAHLAKAIKSDEPERACAAAMNAMADLSPSGDDVAVLTLLRTAADLSNAIAAEPGSRADFVASPHVRWEGRHAVVTMPREIDITNALTVYEFLQVVAAQSPEVVTADLTGTVFCDSAGLNNLLRAGRAIGARNGVLRLALGGSPIRRIVELSGVDQVIPVFDSVEGALAA